MGVKFKLLKDLDYECTSVYTTHGTWSRSHELLDTGLQPFVRAAVMLKKMDGGSSVFVAFGFNWVDVRDRSTVDGPTESHFSLKIRAIYHDGTLSPETFARHWNYVTSCEHKGFPCPLCGKSDDSPASNWVKGTPVGYEDEVFFTRGGGGAQHTRLADPERKEPLNARISMQEAMGETLFQVTIRADWRGPHESYDYRASTGVYELEGDIPVKSQGQGATPVVGVRREMIIDGEQSITWDPTRSKTSRTGVLLQDEIRNLKERSQYGVRQSWPGHGW